jgi:hypothetical protein
MNGLFRESFKEEKGQIMTRNDPQLTERQLKAIPHLVAASTYEEGRKNARVSKNALYTWLREPAFRDELSKQREAIFTEALEDLKSHILSAVSALVGLLSTSDERLRRQVANDVIKHVFKAREILEIEKRLKDLEGIIFGKDRAFNEGFQ